MNKLKKLLALLLCAAMTLGVMPALALAEEGEVTPPAEEGETITRAQWLSQLVEAFGMTVENDDDLPDNYFSDLDPESEYYRDILVAVQYGLVDIEAGDPIKPDDPATREFAAQTTNFGLRFQIGEEEEYTFSEKEDVTYPEDIQIAVNRNWFALVDGSFLPEQPVTATEAEVIFADVKAVLDSAKIDENYDNKVEAAGGVIVVPESTEKSITPADEDGVLSITLNDYDGPINKDDIFVIFANGIPVAMKAIDVTSQDNALIINATKDGTDGAIVSIDIQGSSDVDLDNFVPAEVTTYSVIDTTDPEAAPEDLSVSLQGITWDEKTKTLKGETDFEVGSIKSTVGFTISKVKLNYKLNDGNGNMIATITGDYSLTGSVQFDLGNYAGVPSSIYLGYIDFTDGLGVLTAGISLGISLKGGVTVSEMGKITVGCSYNKHDGFLNLTKFENTGSSMSMEADVDVSLTAALVLDLSAIKINGRVWATVGVKGYYKTQEYKDDRLPRTCANLGGYLYANYGAQIKIDGKPYGKPRDIYTEENSPYKVYYHYEDGQKVDICSRGNTPDNKVYPKYTTKPTSKNYNPSPTYGQSSSGSGGSGEPVVIWEYSLDKDNNATITKYNGRASALAIPSKIDGYTVTGIGARVFQNNKVLRTVVIPNSVTKIGREAFYGCTNLSSANLPLSLEKLEYQAFQNCTSLTHINIPKALNDIGYHTNGVVTSYGNVFEGAGLLSVEFEEGITRIPNNLFWNAAKLERADIPNTVTRIGENAFYGCTGLKEVHISENVTSIGRSAFYGCTSLSSANLPLSLEKLEYQAFQNCTSLTHINIPKALNDIGYHTNGVVTSYGNVFEGAGLLSVEIEEGRTIIPDQLFLNVPKLKSIEIPGTVTKIGSRAFKGCTSLETAKLSSNLTSIASNAFEGCSSLKEIDIPETVIDMGTYIFDGCTGLYKAHIPTIWSNIPEGTFRNCTSLTEITLPDGLTAIRANAFFGCESLPALNLPDSVETIENSAFYGCDALTEVIIPESVISFGSSVFNDCQGLTKAVINASCNIGNEIFRNCGTLETVELNNKGNVAGYTFYNCDALETVIINNIGSVGGYMFYDCDSLVSITFGDGVTSLGSNAFYDCDALTSLTLNDSITSIGASFCYGCELLSEINFGKYIETIPDSAFRLCPALETVKLPHFLKTIAANAFAEDTKLVDVYVPARVSKIENNSFSYPAKTTMHGRPGSYAEEYANSRSMTFDAIDEPITEIAFEESEVDIPIGKTLRPVLNFAPGFDTDIITFVSGDEGVATVSETGVITAKNYGTTTVTALTEDGLRTDIKVLIINPATSVTLSKTTLELEANTSEVLTVTSKPNGNNDSLVWSSGDEKVAVVDQQGNVTAIAPGETDITVKAVHGGVSAVCHVVVSASGVPVVPVTGVKLTPDKCEIMVGGSKTLQAEIVPADATNKALLWSSDNTDVAEVVDGVVTAKAEGKANITVRTAVGGYEAKCVVTVVPKAEITELTATPMGQYALVTVKAVNAPKDAVIYLAAFGGGQLCGAQTVTMTGGSGQVIVPLDGVETLKAVMWDSLDSMRPLCEAKEVEVAK